MGDSLSHLDDLLPESISLNHEPLFGSATFSGFKRCSIFVLVVGISPTLTTIIYCTLRRILKSFVSYYFNELIKGHWLLQITIIKLKCQEARESSQFTYEKNG